jgi:hypothetical protein
MGRDRCWNKRLSKRSKPELRIKGAQQEGLSASLFHIAETLGNPFLFERRRQLRSRVRLNPRAREKLQKTVAAWRVAPKVLNCCVAFCDQTQERRESRSEPRNQSVTWMLLT